MSTRAIIDAFYVDGRKHSLYIGSDADDYSFIKEYIVEPLQMIDIDSRLIGRWNLGSMYTKLFCNILNNHSSSKNCLLLEDHNSDHIDYVINLYPTKHYGDTSIDITEALLIEVIKHGVLLFERMTLAELMK